MRGRHWVSIATLALMVLVVALGWKEIVRAWHLLAKVDLRILALLLPVQFLSYCATGEVLFGYLRSKGYMRSESWWVTPRMALELNFVHHVMPSAGIAGFSYLGWSLKRYGVSPGKATTAQIIQVALTFVSYSLLLALAVIILAFDEKINKSIIVTSAALELVVVASVVMVINASSDRERLERFAGRVTGFANGAVSFVTRGRRVGTVELGKVEEFFNEIHEDYCAIRDDRRLLLRPFLWSAVGNCLDISMLWIAFEALGVPALNPSVLVIAFGLSSVLGMASATPGGTGAYEAAMIVFLSAAGVTPGVAIAGTLLARVTLLLLTVSVGYLFYQMTISGQGGGGFREPPGEHHEPSPVREQDGDAASGPSDTEQ